MLPLWQKHFGERRDHFRLLPERVGEKLRKLLPPSPRGHRIGGYSDVEDMVEAIDNNGLPKILLLRIDTDEKIGIHCRDNDSVNFLIGKEDFEALNFSRVQHSI